jgi:hypothetical protein
MAEASEKTKALEIALNKATKDYSNYKDRQPKPTWSTANSPTADEAIDKLIRNAPVGSAKRQALMDQKAEYHRKLDAWKVKFDQIEKDWYATRDAYQASVKLDPLEKKQQDNKDTGKVDPKTDEQVNALKEKRDAAPEAAGGKPAPAPAIPPIPVDKDGKPVITGTPPKAGVDAQGKPIIGPVPTPTPKPIKTGGGTGGNNPPAKVVVDDSKTAYISALREVIKSLPPQDNLEVTKLLDQAAKSAMTETAFIAELEKTNWWQSSLPSLQAYFIESHDPRKKGTFAQELQKKTDTISSKLESLGIQATQVDPITGKFYDNSKVIQGIASMAMMNGWDDNQLNQHLAETAQLHFTGGGTIGTTIDNIKLNAMKYGVSVDDNYLKQIQFSLLDPSDGRDSQYYINEMKNQAIDMYKPFSDQIKNGRTLYEVTNNYRTKMGTLLETDASNISWKDLMGKVIDPTTGTARMESDFIKQVKQDPLWQYTKNAKETYSNMALDLMKQFGFVG